MFRSPFGKFHRFVLTTLMGLMVFVSTFFPFSAAQAAVPVFDAPLNAYFNAKEVATTVKDNIGAALLGTAVSAVSFFTRRLAYDTAVWVAYGGKGKGALAFKDGFGAYMEKVGQDTAAEAIGALGEPLGLNLCQIPDLRVHAALLIGFRQLYQGPPQPRCSWQDVRKVIGVDGGKAWKERYGTEKGLSETFSGSLSVQNSDFGVALDSMAQLDRITTQEAEGARLARLESQGFKPISDLISGNILTPGQIVKEESTALTRKHQGEESTKQIAGIYGSGFTQIIPQTVSVFLNTLTGELLQQLLEALLDDGGSADDQSLAVSPFADVSFRGNVERANSILTQLLVRTPTQLTNYDGQLIATFAACPTIPGLNNCVIDSGLQDALAQNETRRPMTIQEAIDGGFLHGNWTLVSPQNADHGSVTGCQVGHYCYSNVQKLRKARILPLGFEVAALRSPPDKPWTLAEVVRGFEDCSRPDPTNPQIIEPDPSKPFCHLINPNWIIALPDARCESNVIGPQLAVEGNPIRREECVDISTCIAKDASGECLEYGYCTKEKNLWVMPGRACEPWAKTCTTYANTETNQITSYLGRTIDYGECNVDNKGCRAYSTEKTANVWQASVRATLALKQVGRNQTLYFNEKIASVSDVCKSGSDGCHAFYPALRELTTGQYLKNNQGKYIEDARAPIYYKKAPDYLGCYDTVPDAANNAQSFGNQWPTTLQQVENVVSQDDACNAFASVCIPSEVGCESFIPLKGKSNTPDDAPKVPGIIGGDQVCSSECVGYDVFKQEATVFDKAVFPLYFIPTDGQSCAPEYAGCSEFTNLESLAQGGEALEYYTKIKYCEKPASDRNNLKVYYSWEGSEEQGFVLRVHRLRPVTQKDNDYFSVALGFGGALGIALPVGSPMYADDDPLKLESYVRQCDARTYNLRINDPLSLDGASANCRALYDEEGNVYYRLLPQLVTVADECRALRKTDSRLEKDELMTTLTDFVTLWRIDAWQGRNLCEERGGQWEDLPDDNIDDPVCLRCAGGGTFEDGSCIYHAIPGAEESQTCPATANQCRAYAGNTANNVEQVRQFAFEPTSDDPDALLQAQEGWDGRGLSIAAEAIQVGSHSLQVDAAQSHSVYFTMATGTLKTNNWYELSLWARGGATRMSVRFGGADGRVPRAYFTRDPITGDDKNISVGNTWREYSLGPIQYTGPTDVAVSIIFESQSVNGQPITYFLDEVRLTRLQDYTYLIKDSWKETNGGLTVPRSCDSNPTDGLPGAALGCRAYQEENSKVIRYATGFEQLCRPKAVGCMPVWDTQNTIEGDAASQARVYNAWCILQGPGRCEANVFGVVLGSCEVERGKSGCYIKEMTLPKEIEYGDFLQNNALVRAVTSTVFVPADTPTSTPIFLANRQEFKCDNAQLGCQMVGQETQLLPNPTQVRSYTHADIMVKNDPAKYGETLCRDDLVGCSEYRHDDQISYFKDPLITGNSICEYQSQQNPGEPWGWFVRGVGTCNSGGMCRTSQDCPSFNIPGRGQVEGVCDLNQKVACYPQHFQRGGMYDIWGNESANYTGMVGSCPAQFNRCTELIDPADTSNVHPEGQPYYVIFDKTVEDRLDDCTSVSLRDGCVLFDKTDEPNKYFNSRATYELSARGIPPFGVGGQGVTPYGPVKAVQDPSDLNGDRTISDVERRTIDTNKLIKVDRDRQCSEWLACKTAFPLTQQNGQQGSVCYQYKACDELGEGDAACNRWVDDLDSEQDLNRALFPLDYREYITRPVSWYDEEFSGYSLFNSFQITNFFYQSFTFPPDISRDLAAEAQRNYIVREVADSILERAGVVDEQRCIIDDDRGVNVGVANTDWHACGIDAGGRCYNRRCIYPVDGPFASIIADSEHPTANELRQMLAELDSNVCKSVPELDSPFPINVSISEGREPRSSNTPGISNRKVFTQNVDGFEGAYVCQDGNCSCQYQKITYGSGTVDYWPTQGVIPPEKICSGGPNDGEGCSQDSDCQPEADGAVGVGVCSPITKRETQIGVEGFCLQYDLSRRVSVGQNPFACLTWLPIQVSAAAGDVYNADKKAGYDLAEDAVDATKGQTYCYGATYSARGPYDPDFYADDQAVSDSLGDQFYNQYFTPDGAGAVLDPGGYNVVLNNQNVAAPFFTTCTWEHGVDNDRSASVDFIAANSPYQLATCWSNNFAFLYKAVRSWSWRNWQNSVLLRLESGAKVIYSESGNNDRGGWYDPEDTDRENQGFGVVDQASIRDLPSRENPVLRMPYALVPKPDHCCDQVEFGTLMHEPRLWGDMYDDLNEAYELFVGVVPGVRGGGFPSPQNLTHLLTHNQTQLMNDGTGNPGRETDQFISIAGEGHAPVRDVGPSGFFANNTAGILYRSEAERFINRKDMRRVYFVPLSYPGGIGQDGPSILSQDVYIDMDALDGSESHADARLTYDLAEDANYGDEFPQAKDETDLIVWTYVLSQDTQTNRLSEYAYSDYGEPNLFIQRDYLQDYNNEGANGGLMGAFRRALGMEPDLEGNPGRNQIHKRYVLVFSDWTWDDDDDLPPFILAAVDGEETEEELPTAATIPPSNPEDPYNNEDDPFTAPCNDDVIDFTVIGMDFNADGEFLGYVTRHCNTGGEGSGGRSGIQLAVVATLRDQCSAFIQVYDENQAGLQDTSNKAWTDNVWSGSRVQVANGSILYSTENMPFASLSLTGGQILDQVKPEARYMFSNASKGLPYSCAIRWFGYPTLDEKDAVARRNHSKCDQIRDDLDNATKTNIGAVRSYDEARDTILKNLFVKSFLKKRVGFEEDASGRLIRNVGTGSDDLSGTEGLDELEPPQIYALNPFTCSGGPGGCTAAHKDAITVNGTNAYVDDGVFADYNVDGLFEEDRNDDGQIDALIGIGTYFARVQFFAFADHNRMPIRRVMVNWGPPDEPITNEGKKGFYRNRKPFCEENNDPGHPDVGRCQTRNGIIQQLTCDPTVANACPQDQVCVKPQGPGGLVDLGRTKQFGDLPRACTPGYFEFTHEYSCGLSDLARAGIAGGEYVQQVRDLPEADVLQSSWGLSPDEFVCVYVPKVQALDNWGWCNGTCDDQTRAGNQQYENGGCYNSEKAGERLQCDSANQPSWTSYRGKIIVIPSR